LHITSDDNQIPQALTPETDFYSTSKENITKVFNEIGLGLGFSGSRTQLDLPAWDEVLEHTATRFPSTSISTSLETEATATDNTPKQVTLTCGELLTDEVSVKQQEGDKAELQVLFL